MPEKSIERFEVAYIQGGAVNRPDEKGRYVKYADHLAALGEAEKGLRIELSRRLEMTTHADEETARAEAAEQSLQTLRLSLEAEVERALEEARYLRSAKPRDAYESQSLRYRAAGAEDRSTRLQQLLDQPSETAGES